jgi:Tfp pilus assembly protein PilE
LRSADFTTRQSSPRRHGTTVLELIAAGAILGVLLVVCAQMLSRTAVQQQAISNRRAAIQMTANAMERVASLSWEDLNESEAEAIATTVVRQAMFRDARLAVTVEELDETLRQKKIRITATWKEGSDEVERKQQLTAWRYAKPSGTGTEGNTVNRGQVQEVKP